MCCLKLRTLSSFLENQTTFYILTFFLCDVKKITNFAVSHKTLTTYTASRHDTFNWKIVSSVTLPPIPLQELTPRVLSSLSQYNKLKSGCLCWKVVRHQFNSAIWKEASDTVHGVYFTCIRRKQFCLMNICITMSELVLIRALTIPHIIRLMTCAGHNIYFWTGQRDILRLGGPPSPTTPNCRCIAPLTPPPSCSTFSPGSSEVSECGWVHGGNWEGGLLPAGLADGWVPRHCHCPSKRWFTFPLWSQPVSRRASQAAAESVGL